MVTLDAMGCQRAMAQEIIKGQGRYVLAVKENQPTLHAKVKTLLDEAVAQQFKGLSGDCFSQTNKGHGALKHAPAGVPVKCVISRASAIGKDLPAWQWSKPGEPFRGSCNRNAATTSTASTARTPSRWPRRSACTGAWRIPCTGLWTFRSTRTRAACEKGHGAENLSRLRRIALNKLQLETSKKRSLRAKRLKAGWDHDYLLQILQI